MKESLPLTSKDLVQAFLKTHNNTYNLTEAKDGVYLAELADICLKHGMKKHSCILRLMESVVNWDVTVLFGLDKERTTEQIKLGKDLATLTNIFKNGRRIKIQASMPDGIKETHKTLEIETNSLLQHIASLCFNSFLAQYGLEYEYCFVAKKPDSLKPETLQNKYGITDSGSFFKETYSDEALVDIIEFETSEMDFDKAQRGRTGRTNAEYPRLGRIASNLIVNGGEDLSSMNLTKRYCLVFDLMVAAGISPNDEELRDRELSSKDKYDIVKSWVRSNEKVYTPSNLIRAINPYKPY